jgi:hypothetical protein
MWISLKTADLVLFAFPDALLMIKLIVLMRQNRNFLTSLSYLNIICLKKLIYMMYGVSRSCCCLFMFVLNLVKIILVESDN